MRLWTDLVGSLIEGWAELKIHRARVLLSLVGVGVAVAALTTVLAGGAIATQIQTEQSERYGGRPATISLNAFNPQTGAQPTFASMTSWIASASARYGITYTTRNATGRVDAQLPDGVYTLSVQLVDQAFGVIHRTRLQEGAWFTQYDEKRLAPAIVVSSDLWNRMGAPRLTEHPTIQLVTSERTVVAVITGVVTSPESAQGVDFSAFILNDDYLEFSTNEDRESLAYQYELWVPTAVASELMDRLQKDSASTLGGDWQVEVYRQDYLSQGGDPLLPFKLSIGGVAGLVLLLGALGLVNIAVVTVRYRVREIGIRRSLGATAGRVFFAVMMESVVGTLFAGAIGVLVAVLLVKNPWVTTWLDEYADDVPAFPLEAAVVGLLLATAVGVFVGVFPATIAVRVKVIDAIRY